MITWRTSTYSGGGGSGGQECVQVASVIASRHADGDDR